MYATVDRTRGRHKTLFQTRLVGAPASEPERNYDADYDTLADVLPSESHWIAPRDSLD